MLSKYRMLKKIRGLCLLSILLGITSCQISQKQIQGTVKVNYGIDLPSEARSSVGKPCSSREPSTGFIKKGIKGTKVSLMNARNEVIGVTRLQDGVLKLNERTIDHLKVLDCEMSFTFDSIPDSKFYQVEIKENLVKFSKEELQKKNWTINLRF